MKPTINDLDYAISKLFRLQEALEKAGMKSSPAYEINIGALRSLTAERLEFLGLTSRNLGSMKTTIDYIGTPSNPGTIESLIETLAQYALDPRFEEAGSLIVGPLTPEDFINPKEPPIEMLGKTLFFGNFYEASVVFRLYTDAPDLIARLTKAIQENQASPAYQAAKAEIAEGAKRDRARRAKIERAHQAKRIAAARAVLA